MATAALGSVRPLGRLLTHFFAEHGGERLAGWRAPPEGVYFSATFFGYFPPMITAQRSYPRPPRLDNGPKFYTRSPEREPCRVNCTVLVEGAAEEAALVEDFSHHGFKLSCGSIIAVGSQISLKLPGCQPVQATVRWSIGGAAGCVFRSPVRQDILRAVIEAASKEPPRGLQSVDRSFNDGGQGWIRTSVRLRGQIYSLLPLTTRPPVPKGCPAALDRKAAPWRKGCRLSTRGRAPSMSLARLTART